MGLLGAGNFKTCKFKNLAKLSLSRIAILNKQHNARCSYARSDVVELLRRGQLDKALARVESVIREQNMLDVFTMLETYLHFLTEKIRGIENNKECPDELKEATSSLMFASSRCGEFPELLYIREMIYTKFGKEYVTQAVELQSNCSVNPKMIEKLSPQKPDLKFRLSLLKDIASENGIPLHPESVGQAAVQEKAEEHQKQEHCQRTHRSNTSADHEKGSGTDTNLHAEAFTEEEPFGLATSRIAKKKIVSSKQEAFQPAAQAAETAKYSVFSTEELQGSGSQQLSKHKANSVEILPHDKSPLPRQSNERVPLDSRIIPSLNPLERNLRLMVAQSKPISEHQSKYPNADRQGLSVRTRRA